MALETDKKKRVPAETTGQKSAASNRILWGLVFLLVIVAAVGNIYFAEQYSTPIRVIALAVLLAIAFVLAALTNQGVMARKFLADSRIELRRIVWPTRTEAMQTTLIVMGVTMVVSLVLWAFDSIIITVLQYLTNLRF